jgi:predicted DNA-binding protein YlxM (UPF0122 family)
LNKSAKQIGSDNPNYITFSNLDKQTIIDLHLKDKYSMNKIGKIFKTSPQTIKRVLLENGVNIINHINQHT